eukprot:gene606-3916_t
MDYVDRLDLFLLDRCALTPKPLNLLDQHPKQFSSSKLEIDNVDDKFVPQNDLMTLDGSLFSESVEKSVAVASIQTDLSGERLDAQKLTLEEISVQLEKKQAAFLTHKENSKQLRISLEERNEEIKELQNQIAGVKELLSRATAEVTEATSLSSQQEKKIQSLEVALDAYQEKCANLENEQWSFTSKPSLLHILVGGTVGVILALSSLPFVPWA